MSKRRSNGHTPRQPGPRGWPGRGGGEQVVLQAPEQWRGTTRQVCGLWPHAVGAGTPMVGVPLGITTEGTVLCCDPLSWFQRARLISQPSMFVIGLPALGKSSAIRRIVIGSAAFGAVPVVTGDVRPDYVDTIRMLGGQVIQIGGGRGTLNIMDASGAQRAARRLPSRAAQSVLSDAHRRRKLTVESLISVQRREPPVEFERNVLDRAIKVLDDSTAGVPTLSDLMKLLYQGPAEVAQLARDDGSGDQYREAVGGLLQTFEGVLDGDVGRMFGHETTEPMQHERPVVFDVSSIDESDGDTKAAALLACWATAFGNIGIANELADAGLEPQRNYLIVMDELWSALGASSGLVDRVNSLTRLNRKLGVGQIMCSHTKRDLQAITDPADQAKAMGFVDRSAIKMVFGLSREDVQLLEGSVQLSQAEVEKVVSWSSPPSLRSDGGEDRAPGEGKALIKVGEHPGIAFDTLRTHAEGRALVHDTNVRYGDR